MAPDRVIWVRALAGDTKWDTSWARHRTLSVPLSTRKYKWIPATMSQSALRPHLKSVCIGETAFVNFWALKYRACI